VTEEITKNQTPTEKEWSQALDEYNAYKQIPRWLGITPDQTAERVKEEATYATMRQTNPAGANAYRLTHALLRRKLPTNPARDTYLLQHPLLQKWFVAPSAKLAKRSRASLSYDNFGEPVQAPWEQSPATPPGQAVAPTG